LRASWRPLFGGWSVSAVILANHSFKALDIFQREASFLGYGGVAVVLLHIHKCVADDLEPLVAGLVHCAASSTLRSYDRVLAPVNDAINDWLRVSRDHSGPIKRGGDDERYK
jgi:hypothetical protein